MQRALIFMMAWVIALVVLMVVMYVGYRLVLKCKRDFLKSEKENEEYEQK